MRPPLFNYTLPFESRFLIYNCLTDALICLDKPLEPNTISDLDEQQRKILIESGFILCNPQNEQLIIEKLLEPAIKKHSQPLYGHITITPTLCCNARCFYCYEAKSPHMSMNSITAEKTVEYIRSYAMPNAPLKITWFGGEPMLAQSTIQFISSELKAANIEFTASMITNGSKINQKSVQFLIGNRIKHVQLSIDGFEDEYEKRKSYVDGTSFYDIMDGIDYCVQNDIHISLRLNIDSQNISSIHELIRYINTRFGSDSCLTAYPSLLYGNCPNKFQPESACTSDTIISIMEHLQAVKMIDGKCFTKKGIIKYPCMAHDEASVVIDPDGYLYHCEHDVGQKSLSIGNVFNNHPVYLERSQSEIIPLSNKASDCFRCPFLPKCRGGCDATRRDGESPCGIIKYAVNMYMLSKANMHRKSK